MNCTILISLLLLCAHQVFAQQNPVVDTSTLKQKVFEPLHSSIVLKHDTTISFNETYHWIDFNLERGVMIEQNFQTRKAGFFSQQLTPPSWDSGRVILKYIPKTNLGLDWHDKKWDNPGWTDTISAFDIRYNYLYIEASLAPMGMWGQPRTLYRYWDGKPLLTLNSNLYVVEGIAPYSDKAYVGYLDNNHYGMDETDSNIIGKLTFVTGLGLNEPPLRKQIVRIQTRFDLDDRGSEEQVSKLRNSAIWLEVTSNSDTFGKLVNSRNANFGEEWIDADKRDFMLILKCRGDINETFRIPIHNGKLNIRSLHSKYFKFSFE